MRNRALGTSVDFFARLDYRFIPDILWLCFYGSLYVMFENKSVSLSSGKRVKSLFPTDLERLLDSKAFSYF